MSGKKSAVGSSDSSDYYSSIAEGYNELHKDEQEAKYALVLANLDSRDLHSVLDIGCGTCLFESFWRGSYTGIDNAVDMIKGRKNTILASAESIPFPDNSFDAAVCFSALHNFENPARAISEMVRITKSVIVISVLKRARNFSNLIHLCLSIKGMIRVFDNPKDRIFIIQLH